MRPSDTVGIRRFHYCNAEARTNPSMPTQRFLQLTEVSEVLNISAAQAYALVRSGELPAIKVGGRGQWRVETTDYLRRQASPCEPGQVSTLMTRDERALVGAVR